MFWGFFPGKKVPTNQPNRQKSFHISTAFLLYFQYCLLETVYDRELITKMSWASFKNREFLTGWLSAVFHSCYCHITFLVCYFPILTYAGFTSVKPWAALLSIGNWGCRSENVYLNSKIKTCLRYTFLCECTLFSPGTSTVGQKERTKKSIVHSGH